MSLTWATILFLKNFTTESAKEKELSSVLSVNSEAKLTKIGTRPKLITHHDENPTPSPNKSGLSLKGMTGGSTNHQKIQQTISGSKQMASF